jgi:hypothetical protein
MTCNCLEVPAYDPGTGPAPCVRPDEESNDGWYFGIGIADYSGNQYLVYGLGFRAISDAPINGTTEHNEFKVKVVDLSTGSKISNFIFKNTLDFGEIDVFSCEVKDFDLNGNDDLIITSQKDHPTIPDKVIKKVRVFDLQTKDLIQKFTYNVGD